MNSSGASPASPRENTVSFCNGKENDGINSELQKPGSCSPSHKEHKSSHLRGQFEDNSLSCLILHQLMLWESGLVQCHVRIIDPLTQQILEVSECHLGHPYGLQKKTPHHPFALLQLHCSQTNLSQTTWGTTLAMVVGAHSNYTEPETHQGDKKCRTTIKHWHFSQCRIHAFCEQELLPSPVLHHQRDARSPSRKQPRVFSFVTP